MRNLRFRYGIQNPEGNVSVTCAKHDWQLILWHDEIPEFVRKLVEAGIEAARQFQLEQEDRP